MLNGMSETTVLKQFITDIKNAPTVEPKKGEWIRKSLDPFRKYSVTCPFCESEYVDNYDGYIDAERFNFCPSCGADMRGDTG